MEQAPGSIATDLQVRGSLLGTVKAAAKQELVCVAVSDSIWNTGAEQRIQFIRTSQHRLLLLLLYLAPSALRCLRGQRVALVDALRRAF
eukprot:COSAG02_NODE_21459_length_787_cov_0.915698_1_plen_88_part_10